MMRDAPLTTVKGGISRLRTKGGARADTLYDLVNGYCTDEGTIVSRQATRRIAKLRASTRGLCAYKGTLHTFCHQATYVPEGFTLNLIVHPDIINEDDPADFTLVAGKFESTPVYDVFIGFDNDLTVDGAPAEYGSITPGVLTNGAVIVSFYTRGGDPLTSAIRIRLATEAGAAAPSDSFQSFTFTDTHGIERTFDVADSYDPAGYDGGQWREWTWNLPDDPAEVFVEGETYTITFDETTATTTSVKGNTIALDKIHFAEPFMGALYVIAEFENGNVYHYWLQEGEQWEANKVYKAGDIVYPETNTGVVYRASRLGSANPPWAPNVLRYDGTEGSGYEVSVIEPTTYNDYYYTCIAATGASPRSGSIEPAWPTEDGATVIESTDNPPDVNIPTTTTVGTNAPASVTTDRYGTFADNRQVLR